MKTLLTPTGAPWRIEVIVSHRSHSSAERRAVSRDVARGLLLRICPRVYVERLSFLALTPEEQHIVRMRAIAATSTATPVFSHQSAAIPHGLPVMRHHLRTVHVTVEDEDDRHRQGLTMHRFLTQDSELVRFGDLVVTGVGRTVVDIAGAVPFDEGVMAASGALTAGVPRELLEDAILTAGPRRAAKRIRDAIAFGHPGAETAGESRTLVTWFRLGVEVPILQHRLVLSDGSDAFLDGLFPSVRVGAEFDGVKKFLDAEMAPTGAAQAVIAEKWREDEVRAQLNDLARFGWLQAGSQPLMRGILARVGVVPPRTRVTFEDYAAAARVARPRRVPANPQRGSSGGGAGRRARSAARCRARSPRRP